MRRSGTPTRRANISYANFSDCKKTVLNDLDREPYLDDYFLARVAQTAEELERLRREAANLLSGGAATGQIAVWDGSAFVPGALTGDGNGITVVVVSSPFGLQIQQSQDLK